MKFTAAFIALVAPVLAAPAPQFGMPGMTLSFGGRLIIAEKVVAETQAGCLLWHAKATSSNGFPAGIATGLDRITATFSCSGAREGPVMYTVTEIGGIQLGEFNAPVKSQGGSPRGSKLVGELPLPIDLPQAEKIFQSTGRRAAVSSVDLSWIVSGTTTDQPFYWFNLVDRTRIGVGAYTGRIIF